MVDGEKIRRLRSEADMTLVEFADAIGLSIAQMSYIETCLKLPSVPVLERIAIRLGVTMDELMKAN